jgi:hypothetical protein
MLKDIMEEVFKLINTNSQIGKNILEETVDAITKKVETCDTI